MNDNFIKVLEKLESKWLEVLFSRVKELFNDDPLPSHDEEHHLRVWNNAKGLVSELNEKGVEIDNEVLEELIIAIFFHDTGMSINREKDHGKESRALCSDWMDEVNYPKGESRERILYAVEYHDDKSYKSGGGFITGGRISILTVLNVCDDLDAFSYCGIYRYSEIYLLRGIPIEELGQQVIANASARFGNFLSCCMQLPGMIRAHTGRYKVLEDFFRQYNAQLHKDPTGISINTGPVNIVKIFYRQILIGIDSVDSLCCSAIGNESGMYEKNFFDNLRKEWCKPEKDSTLS
jgi:hypothetical protein